MKVERRVWVNAEFDQIDFDKVTDVQLTCEGVDAKIVFLNEDGCEEAKITELPVDEAKQLLRDCEKLQDASITVLTMFEDSPYGYSVGSASGLIC